MTDQIKAGPGPIESSVGRHHPARAHGVVVGFDSVGLARAAPAPRAFRWSGVSGKLIAKKMLVTEEVSGGLLMSVTRGG